MSTRTANAPGRREPRSSAARRRRTRLARIHRPRPRWPPVEFRDVSTERGRVMGAGIVLDIGAGRPVVRPHRSRGRPGRPPLDFLAAGRRINSNQVLSRKEEQRAVKWIPEGYHVVTPYFVVPGAGEFIEFLKEAFSAQESERLGRPDGAIMHAEVSIGDSVIMLGDASPEFGATRSSTHLYVDDVDAAYDRALQAGGESLREPQDQFS